MPWLAVGSTVMIQHALAHLLDAVGPTHLERVRRPRFESAGVTRVERDVIAESVDVAGSTSIGDDLHALEIDAAGATGVGGQLQGGTASFSGSISIDDVTSVERLEVNGSGSFAAIEADSVEVNGALDARDVRAEHLAVNGALRTGDVDADRIDIDGACDAGVLTARTVELELGTSDASSNLADIDRRGRSTVERIHGGDVRIERSRANGLLVADRIVGDRLELDAVEVDRVEGTDVRLGPDAHVEMLAAETVEIASGAHVDRRIRD